MNPMVINRHASIGDATSSISICVMVVLGNPRNADCSQHGICRIDTTALPPCNCRHQSKAWLSTPETGVVRLIFEYTSMQEASIEYFFQENHFQVTSSYMLPESVMEKLGMPGEILHIEPGAYPIFRYSGFLEITFRQSDLIR